MKIHFDKYTQNPVIPRTPGTFYSKYSANPDVLLFQDKYCFYFRGQDEHGHDQIGVGYTTTDRFDGVNWNIPSENPVIRISGNPKDFDSGYILDPATIIVDGKVYLYYTAHRSDWQSWNIPSYIGLAISEDGINFKKYHGNPVIMGMAPEVVHYNNRFYLFYQRLINKKCFHIFCCESEDGIHFDEAKQVKVFEPSPIENTFDSYSISTVRIWHEGGLFYLFYGGCDRFIDYPIAIGLARSNDLINWERYPFNPILERGEAGSWDEGGVWFATVHKHHEIYYLWYEGTGTGNLLKTREAIEASQQCRDEDYGGYGITSFSQIGMATYRGSLMNW